MARKADEESANGVSYTFRRNMRDGIRGHFHIEGADGETICHGKQVGRFVPSRMWVSLFSDEARTEKVVALVPKKVRRFAITFDVTLPSGEILCSFRSRSMIGPWVFYGNDDEEIGKIKKTKGRSYLVQLLFNIPSFTTEQADLVTHDGLVVATYSAGANPICQDSHVTIHCEHDQFDDLVILAAGCMLGNLKYIS